MTIPRRDLLTGAALVLVGSASGCGGGKQQAGTAPAAGAAPALLRTQFISDFTAEFIGDPTKILDPGPPPQKDRWPDPNRRWPATGQTLPSIVNDYATFVNVLMTVGYVMASPPAAPSGSLGDRIVQFLQTQNWPTKTTFPPGSPPEYNDELPTVHLVEIAVITLAAVVAIGAILWWVFLRKK